MSCLHCLILTLKFKILSLSGFFGVSIITTTKNKRMFVKIGGSYRSFLEIQIIQNFISCSRFGMKAKGKENPKRRDCCSFYFSFNRSIS